MMNFNKNHEKCANFGLYKVLMGVKNDLINVPRFSEVEISRSRSVGYPTLFVYSFHIIKEYSISPF